MSTEHGRLTEFQLGYICALTGLIQAHGMSSPIAEAFRNGIIVSLSLDTLLSMGMDEYDAELLRPHWDEIQRKWANQ